MDAVRTQNPIDFQTDAHGVLSRLVSAAASLLAKLERHPQKSSDVVRDLGLDRKLGWQFFRIATASDPLLAGAYLLSPALAQRILHAAEERGISSEVRNRLSNAFEDCEALIHRHAVDRESFALMAASTAESATDLDNIPVAVRRAAFKAQSRILGVTALSTFKTFIFHPGDPECSLGDVVSLRGTSELIPLRPQLRWPISWARTTTSNHDNQFSTDKFCSLPGCETNSGLSLVEQFCSQPIPKIEHHSEQDGSIRTDLALGGVGRTHSTTVVMGYHAPGMLATRKSVDNDFILANFDIRVPCEYCYLDVLVHPDLGWTNEFHLKVFGDHFRPEASTFGRSHDLLPLHSEVIRGAAMHVTAVQPPIDRYQKLLGWACSSMGWDLDEFEATRVVIEFPVMPSTLSMCMEL